MLSTVEWIKLHILTKWNNRLQQENEQIVTKFNNIKKLTKLRLRKGCCEQKKYIYHDFTYVKLKNR